jgi:hypothetical protein
MHPTAFRLAIAAALFAPAAAVAQTTPPADAKGTEKAKDKPIQRVEVKGAAAERVRGPGGRGAACREQHQGKQQSVKTAQEHGQPIISWWNRYFATSRVCRPDSFDAGRQGSA